MDFLHVMRSVARTRDAGAGALARFVGGAGRPMCRPAVVCFAKCSRCASAVDRAGSSGPREALCCNGGVPISWSRGVRTRARHVIRGGPRASVCFDQGRTLTGMKARVQQTLAERRLSRRVVGARGKLDRARMRPVHLPFCEHRRAR